MDMTRCSGIFNASRLDITLIGAGGIGAITAVVLGKMGVGSLLLIDDDTVDDVNIATQFHLIDLVGHKKVRAVEELTRSFADGTDFYVLDGRVGPGMTPDTITNQIIISAVDSIKARQEIWEVIIQTGALYYLDARMGAESFQLYVVDMSDWSWYDTMINQQDDKDVLDLPCTAKSTIYCAAVCAGEIGEIVKEIAVGQDPPKFIVHNIADHILIVP